MASARELLGLGTGDETDARQGMTGIDRHGPAEPIELLLRTDAGVDGLRVGGCPAVLPSDRRPHRRAVGIDEDVGVDLRADTDAAKAAQIVAGGKLHEGIAYGRHPRRRVLLSSAVSRPVHGVGARKYGQPVAVEVDQDRLDGSCTDIDADERLTHYCPPKCP